MRLKIEDLKNPVVEAASSGTIPANGALINVAFEPNPRLMLSSRETDTIIFSPQENGGVNFSGQNGKNIYLLTLPELKAWRLLTAFIAVEYYLNQTINYRPQIVAFFLKTLKPAAQ